MHNRCSVIGCNAKKWKKVSYHRFPKNESKMARWVSAIGRQNLNSDHKYLSICSHHFDDHSINRTLGILRIKDDAIPTINFNFPNKNDPKTRKRRKYGDKTNVTSDEEFPKIVTISSKKCSRRKKHKICRVCMSVNADEPAQSVIERSFVNITGIENYQETLKDDLALALCESCWKDFYLCQSFIEKTQKTNAALCEMKIDGKLNLKNIKESLSRNNEDKNSGTQKRTTLKRAVKIEKQLDEGKDGDDDIDEDKDENNDDEEDSDEKSEVEYQDSYLDLKSEENNQCDDEEITIYYTKSEEELSEADQDEISATCSDRKQAFVTHLLQKISKTTDEKNIETLESEDNDAVTRKDSNGSESIDFKEVLVNTKEHEHSNHKDEDINEFKMDIELNETEFIENDNFSENELFSDDDSDVSFLARKPKPKRKRKIDKVHQDKTKDGDNEKIIVKRKRLRVINPGENFPYKDFFTIKTFSLEEQKAVIEKRKYTKNYINSPFKCNDCYKGFLNKVSFERHRSRHSDAWGKYECEVCKHRFPTSAYCSKHLARHRANYSCKLCKYTAIDRSQSIRHALEHKGKTSHQCQHCGLQFAKNGTYLSHLRIKHATQFACEFCGFAYLSDRGLEIHKNYRHRHERENNIVPDGPECTSCKIKFASDVALITHMRVSHRKATDGKVRNEESYNLEKYSLKCEKCGESLRNGRAYRSHFRTSHPGEEITQILPRTSNTLMCDQCGRVFTNKLRLLQHASVHAQPQPNQCLDCGKQCSSEADLKLHNLSWHVKQPTPKYGGPDGKSVSYPCSICGKCFVNYSNRVRHMVLHSGLRPYKCERCDNTFKTQGEVKSHTRHVHMKVPWPKKTPRTKVKASTSDWPIG